MKNVIRNLHNFCKIRKNSIVTITIISLMFNAIYWYEALSSESKGEISNRGQQEEFSSKNVFEIPKATANLSSAETRTEIKKLIYIYFTKISDIGSKDILKKLKSAVNNLNVSTETARLLLQDNRPIRVPKSLRIKYPNDKWKGLSLPVLSVKSNGRLGNVLGEYATLFALKKIYNVSVVLMPSMKKQVMKCFQTPSIPTMIDQDNESKKWLMLHKGRSGLYNYASFEVAAAGLYGPQKILLHDFPFEIQLFNIYRDELIQEFRFHYTIQRKVHLFLQSVATNETSKSQSSLGSQTFIGVHVRRTDYLRHISKFNGYLPGEKYFKKAFEYYRKKFSNPVFIASSDDPEYIRQHFRTEPNLHFTPEASSKCEDIAILASCNHSIITLGSFGFWTAYLAGGEVIYPDIKTSSEYRFSRKFYEEANLHQFTPIRS